MRIERHAMLGSLFKDSGEKIVREKAGNETAFAVRNDKKNNSRQFREEQERAHFEQDQDEEESTNKRGEPSTRNSGLNIVA